MSIIIITWVTLCEGVLEHGCFQVTTTRRDTGSCSCQPPALIGTTPAPVCLNRMRRTITGRLAHTSMRCSVLSRRIPSRQPVRLNSRKWGSNVYFWSHRTTPPALERFRSPVSYRPSHFLPSHTRSSRGTHPPIDLCVNFHLRLTHIGLRIIDAEHQQIPPNPLLAESPRHRP